MSVIFGLTVDTDSVDKSFGESFGGWDDIQKALTHKYIRRIPKKSGKGYWYIYAETFQKPLAALKTFFGLQTKSISDTYEKNDIKKDFGADKKTFAAHLLEYLSNKLKWDTFFKKKENSDGYKAPKKSPPAGNGGGKKTGGTVDKNAKQGDNKIVLNRSLMRRIWGIYNKTEEENGTNNIGNERGEISDVASAVRSGGSEESGDQYVSGTETGDNGGEPLQLPNGTGDRPARDVRRTVKETKNIREACLNLLNSKTDDQMTEEDKALLRQYEGAGGLGEEGASTHGTLYEYYTPRTVTKKVWEIVDKYIPGKKNVLEPSSGIGRFAEDRPDDVFTLNEFDKTSARIAGILHPDKNVKQGAFQEMFKPGKEYKGQKYDVVIGNPPYGKYEGLWKGRGEGKGHTRYEEYFIDRGLDTMREGGIMAFVVPSDFLRKGNSKIKEKIAAKGKLLEAWRLPNGTFNTTGVGTDIVIIRKETGDPADFSDNAFFEKNPDMVMGAETTRIGRYGKEEKYIGLADGESFDEAIDRIRADKIEAAPIGAKTQAEQAEENVKVVVEGGKINKKDQIKIKQNNYEIDKLKFEISEQERTLEYMRPEIEAAKKYELESGNKDYPLSGAIIRDGKEKEEYINRLKGDIDKLERENRELEKPKGRSLSEAMLGNDNAKKAGRINKMIADLKKELEDGKEQYEQDKIAEKRVEDQNKNGTVAFLYGSTVSSYESKKEQLEWLEATPYEAIMTKLKDDNLKRIAALEDGIKSYEKQLSSGHAKNTKQIGHCKEVIKNFKSQIKDMEYDNIQMELEERTRKEKAAEKPSAGRTRSEAMMGNQNAAGSHDVDSLAEFNRKYNKNIPEAAIPIWKATNWDGSIDISQLKDTTYLEKSGNYVKTADGKWYDIVNYASGNIYQKLKELERDKEDLSAAEYKRQKAILEAAKPTPKTVHEFTVSPLSDFAGKYVIEEELNDKQDSLIQGFKDWVWDLGMGSVPPSITKHDIIDYVNRKSVRADSKASDKEAAARERDNTIKVRREATEALFNQYIREQLSTQEQERMADMWNKQFNAVVDSDHTKIPAFVDGISRTFKGDPLKVSDIQLKGVATLVNKGNGILAYDVGVGKTLTGILATVSQIQTGRAKKPLICVPKSVYKNWIAEIQQLFPNIKINDLYNFRNIEHLKNPDGTLNIEEGTLSICTYEATQMISFKPETINNELMADMLDSQSAVGVKASDRDKAAEKERIQTKLGKATKAGDKQTNWEDTGFDHITVDELHNFKNIFSQAKGKEKTTQEEGNANEFTKITGGTPSDQALKLFAITQMVQRENNGRNVFGLTATPFTNSPIEIYNILSLVAREKLKETGIYNLHEFMAQFAALKSELAVDSQGDVAEKTVMKEFKNLVALQKLINTYIDKVDGEEAGVIRPKKSIHYEDCTLNMTLAQKDIAEQIIHYMDTADPKEDPGAALKGINALRQLALSPRLLEKSNIVTLPDDLGDFVTSSPKMTFVCDSAAELSKTAGQVIYLPQGISYYKEVKEYLVKRGVDPEAVAFLSPQHLPSGTNKDGSDRGEEEKARIMKDFNDPNGKIKIIIGSETIKEGVNLNGNTSTLYNCMLDWNPTDAIQVEGRIHRQGNKQGHVHIVYPLMNDSIDSFMYQKHDEKSKRIAAVFSYKGDTLNVEEINPEEAKFSLIKDPAKRAGMQIKQEIEVIKNQVLIAQATCDKIVENSSRRREYQEEIKNCQKQLEQIKKAAKKISEMSDAELIREYGNKYRENDESIEQRFDEFDGVKESSWVEGKNPKDFRKEYDRVSKAATQYLQKYITSARSKSETVENTLKRYNVDPTSEKSATDVATKFGKEAAKLKEKIKNIESKRNEYIEKARVQIAKEAKPGLTVADATKLVTKDIIKNLRPMDEVKEEILAEREAKKNETVKKSVVFVIETTIQKRAK